MSGNLSDLPDGGDSGREGGANRRLQRNIQMSATSTRTKVLWEKQCAKDGDRAGKSVSFAGWLKPALNAIAAALMCRSRVGRGETGGSGECAPDGKRRAERWASLLSER